jgi:hypothetical protein
MDFRDDAELQMASALRALITRITEPALREFESLRVAFDVRSEAVAAELMVGPNSIDPTCFRGIIDQLTHRAGERAEVELASVRAEAEAQYEADRREHAALTAALEQAKVQLDSMRAEVETARVDAERALAAPMRELADTRAQLEDARAQVQQAREEIARITEAAAARSDSARAAVEAIAGAREATAPEICAEDVIQSASEFPVGANPPGDGPDQVATTIRALGESANLTQVLDALLDGLGVVFPRVALFVVMSRSQRLQGWRSIGFNGAAAISKKFELSLATDSVLTRAVKTGRATVAGSEAPDRDQMAADTRLWSVTIPVTIGDRVVAVVHGDAGERLVDSSSSFDREVALTVSDLLVRHAGDRLATLTASAQMTFSDLTSDAPALSDAIEGSAERPRQEAPRPTEEARRYARLLVSEIKRYTQANGLALPDRNLDERLKGEIERCRTLYIKRVPPDAGGTINCFDEVLVEMLGGSASDRPAAIEEPVGARP